MKKSDLMRECLCKIGKGIGIAKKHFHKEKEEISENNVADVVIDYIPSPPPVEHPKNTQKTPLLNKKIVKIRH